MDAKVISKKIPGKDQPELVSKSFVVTITEYISANLKVVGFAALGIVVLLALGIGWGVYKRNLNEKAVALENEAFDVFSKVSAAENAEKPEQPAKSYQDVLKLYQQLIAEYPGTASAERARYLCGSLEYTLGDYEKARQDFSAYVNAYPNGKLRLQAEESLGYLFEQQKEYQKAIEQFKSLEAKVSPSKKGELLLAVGRNYESLQQPENAVKTYQSIVDANTSASWKDKAKERLEILQAGSAPTPEKPQANTPAAANTPAEALKASSPAVEATPAK